MNIYYFSKQIITATIITTSLFGCKPSSPTEQNLISTEESQQSMKLNIQGSETLKPVFDKIADDFARINKNYELNVVGGGSNYGINALLKNETDLVMSSRGLSYDELQRFKAQNKAVVETIIGYDALKVIVNVENKVQELTIQQLADIFTLKITNWKEVGGDDMPIHIISRDNNSGSYKFFNTHLRISTPSTYYKDVATTNEELLIGVGAQKNAIGYIGLAFNDNETKPLNIIFDEKTNVPVTPNFRNIIDNRYELSRPLFCVYTEDKKDKLEHLLTFLLADVGQNVILETGYLPVNLK